MNNDKKTARPTPKPKLPKPPETYTRFIARHPDLGRAWELVHEAGSQGPLDEKTVRLVKLAVAIGAMREGAVHSAVRKARAVGIDEETLDQVVALAASTLGFPSTVAIFSWVEDEARAATTKRSTDEPSPRATRAATRRR